MLLDIQLTIAHGTENKHVLDSVTLNTLILYLQQIKILIYPFI